MAMALQDALSGRAHTEETLSSAWEDFERKKTQTAALSVQGATRCLLARKRVKAVRAMRAAVCIQSILRAFAAQRMYQESRSSIVKVQALSRRRVARSRYLSVQRACAVLQNHTAGCRLRRQYRACRDGTMLAQAVLRGEWQRRAVEEECQVAVREGLTALSPYWRFLQVSPRYIASFANSCVGSRGLTAVGLIKTELRRMRTLNLAVTPGATEPAERRPARPPRASPFSCAACSSGGPTEAMRRRQTHAHGLRSQIAALPPDLGEAIDGCAADRENLYAKLSRLKAEQLRALCSDFGIDAGGKLRKAQLLAALEDPAAYVQLGLGARVCRLVLE